jgi:hypothetical protein
MTDAPDGVPAAPNLQDRQATLGGNVYTLRFSFVAAAALKDAWGLTWADDTGLLQRALSGAITDVPVLLWGLMQRHHPEVTREQVVALCDDLGLSDELGAFTRVAHETIRAGWGAPKKKPEAAAVKKAAAAKAKS